VSSGAYGAGAPSYGDAELQRRLIEGRLEVARGIRDRAEPGSRTRARWERTVDDLLDRLLEVRGR
jgi:hypothetical protein